MIFCGSQDIRKQFGRWLQHDEGDSWPWKVLQAPYGCWISCSLIAQAMGFPIHFCRRDIHRNHLPIRNIISFIEQELVDSILLLFDHGTRFQFLLIYFFSLWELRIWSISLNVEESNIWKWPSSVMLAIDQFSSKILGREYTSHRAHSYILWLL